MSKLDLKTVRLVPVEEAAPKRVSWASPAPQVPVAEPVVAKTEKRQRYLRSDSGNAELFAKLHGQNVRFDHEQKRWLLWNDKRGRWVEDKQGSVRGLMKITARERLRAALERPHNDDDKDRKREVKWAVDSESCYRIDSALELAKSEPPVKDGGDG